MLLDSRFAKHLSILSNSLQPSYRLCFRTKHWQI